GCRLCTAPSRRARRPGPTLMPSTTLFRSEVVAQRVGERLQGAQPDVDGNGRLEPARRGDHLPAPELLRLHVGEVHGCTRAGQRLDRKSTRLNSSHVKISYAVIRLKKQAPQ